jgi:hypothetical protein
LNNDRFPINIIILTIFLLLNLESIIKFKSEEFEIGKRHLAKMMGKDPNLLDDNSIDVN